MMPPFMPVPVTTPKPSTIAKRMGVEYCTLCNLAVLYCKCGSAPARDAESPDGAETRLAKRIAEAQGRR
jgi:hypothetical protein